MHPRLALSLLATALAVGPLGCGGAATGGGSDGPDASMSADGGGDLDGGGSNTDGGIDSDGGGSDGGGSDGGGSDGGGSDGGGNGGATSRLCDAHTWNAAVPASGSTIMAYSGKAYLFGTSTTWTIIENGAASTGAIPLPAGVTAMQSVVAEMAPSGRPFVTFTNNDQRWGAFFDGAGFVGLMSLGGANTVNTAHADASERIYAYGINGLTEYAGGSSIIRGAFPISSPKTWTVAADGTVYVLYGATRPSTIHPGDQSSVLKLTRLRHGSLSWGEDAEIGSNEGWGFGTVRIAAAPDGSLHVAYVPLGIYFRSHDGTTWQTENLISFHEHAAMIDPASPGIDGEDVWKVKGDLYMVAAQDYDHASAVFTYNGGSFSIPSYYYLRRCPPFDPTFPAWPAERFAMSGTAFAPTPVAVDEHGMVSIATYYGVRQDVTQ